MAPEVKEKPDDVEEGSKDVQQKVDLDKILVEEMGQYGLYQFRTNVLAVIMVIFAAWASSEYVFTTARINHRCLIPECETGAQGALFSPPWLEYAVPTTSGGSFDSCTRFSATASSTNDSCSLDSFDRENIIQCDDHVYENTDSVVYDYGLACDEWRRSLIGTIRTFGTFTALPITGFISDHWGRRTALAINAFNTAWLGITRYWANTYVGFLISEVVESTFGSGGFSCAYILLMELVGPKYRVVVGASMNSFFSVGQITMGLIAWGVPNWRNLTLVLYIPQLFTLAYFWIISESVRWYMSKGRFDESEAVLKKVAKVNGKQLSEKSLRALRETAEQEKKKLLEQSEESEPWLVVLVFRNKPILVRCLVSPVWWITTTLVYYGLSINSVNLSGNRYLNYVAVSAMEIPGYWTAVFLMNIIGRKPVLILAFWICGACQVGYILMPNDLPGLSLALYFIGKYSIAMVMTSVYVYTAELYPTKYRHRLFAFSSMMGRIGSMIAPLTPAFGAAVWDDFPFALFGGFALLSGALVFVTPETLGSKLPDTMEEASAIGRDKTNKKS